MKENNENLTNEMNEEVETNESLTVVQDFSALNKTSTTKTEVFTNITDRKKIFNLESVVDNLLNECENEKIRVKGVLIKRFSKLMKEPLINEETGEIIKDTEFTYSTILVDDMGKSYATGSKIFTIQLMKYLQMFDIPEEGVEIKIVKIQQKTGNKALGFELV